MSLKCSICEKLITKDRYNISHVLERQDFPPNGDWQELTDFYLENVCPNCQERITKYSRGYVAFLKKHKGRV